MNKTLILLYKFLDVSIILHQKGRLETDTFYKEISILMTK